MSAENPSEALQPFDRDEQYHALVQSMRRVRPLALVGAGASMAPGYPSWDQLLKQLGDELLRAGPDVVAPKLPGVVLELQDPAWQAEEFYNSLGAKRFNAFIREAFAEREVAEPHHLIAGLGFRHILTTNFEPCAEIALKQAMGRPPKRVDWTKLDQVQEFFADLTDPDAPCSVVYLHGHAGEPDNVVLTESAYSRTYLREENRRRLIALFMTQPVVFVGFSMNDPDLAQIMREVLFSLPNRPDGTDPVLAIGAPPNRAMRHFALFGYRTLPERDLVRRRMEGKFGLQTVFYRVSATPDGKAYSHDNLLDLLEAIGADLAASTSEAKSVTRSVAAGSAAPSLQVPLGGDRLTAPSPIPLKEEIFDLDPNKGVFGGYPIRDGFELKAANIKEKSHWVEFDLVVEATEPELLRGTVQFHFHPTFSPTTATVRVRAGRARTTVRAVGAFTVGAEVGSTKLELDLADDARFPTWFRES